MLFDMRFANMSNSGGAAVLRPNQLFQRGSSHFIRPKRAACHFKKNGLYRALLIRNIANSTIFQSKEKRQLSKRFNHSPLSVNLSIGYIKKDSYFVSHFNQRQLVFIEQQLTDRFTML